MKNLGKTALIKELNKVGIVTKVDQNGTPLEVTVGSDVIDVVNLTVKIYSLIKKLIFIIKSIFKKQ